MSRGEVPEGGAWPTRAQALLLAAALQTGEAAERAWRGWKAAVDFESGLDGGSYRLLPLVYRNLSRQGLNDPLLGRLKGVYRLTWYKNQLLFRTMAEVLRGLGAAGVPALVLKGASLTALYYRDKGLRPMDDGDVLVPEAQLDAALKALTAAGWTPSQIRLEKLTAEHRALRPSCGLRDAAGRGLDLHWHVLMECCQPGADADFWQGAVPFTLEGAPALTLNASDHLLHTCLHGLEPNVVPPVRWVADAVVLLREAGAAVDWERLCALAEARGLGRLLHGALDYLRRGQHAPVPEAVLSRLHRRPATRQQETEFRARTRPVGVLGALPVGWSLYLRHRPPRHGLDLVSRALTFPRYLRVTQGFDHTWQVFTWAATRALAVARAGRHGQRAGEFKVAVTEPNTARVE